MLILTIHFRAPTHILDMKGLNTETHKCSDMYVMTSHCFHISLSSYVSIYALYQHIYQLICLLMWDKYNLSRSKSLLEAIRANRSCVF